MTRKVLVISEDGPAPRIDNYREIVSSPARGKAPVWREPVVVPLDRDECDDDMLRLRMEEWQRGVECGVDMVRSSAGNLDRDVREQFRSDQAPIPVIGVEWGYTDQTRLRMLAADWATLVAYYLQKGGVRALAKRLGVGKSQAHTRLIRAQAAFWDVRRQVIADANAMREAYQRMARGSASDEFAVAGLRDRSAMEPSPVKIISGKEKKTCFSSPDSSV